MAKNMCKTHIKLQNAKQKISFFGVRQFNMQFTHVFLLLASKNIYSQFVLKKYTKLFLFGKPKCNTKKLFVKSELNFELMWQTPCSGKMNIDLVSVQNNHFPAFGLLPWKKLYKSNMVIAPSFIFHIIYFEYN